MQMINGLKQWEVCYAIQNVTATGTGEFQIIGEMKTRAPPKQATVYSRSDLPVWGVSFKWENVVV